MGTNASGSTINQIFPLNILIEFPRGDARKNKLGVKGLSILVLLRQKLNPQSLVNI